MPWPLHCKIREEPIHQNKGTSQSIPLNRRNYRWTGNSGTEILTKTPPFLLLPLPRSKCDWCMLYAKYGWCVLKYFHVLPEHLRLIPVPWCKTCIEYDYGLWFMSEVCHLPMKVRGTLAMCKVTYQPGWKKRESWNRIPTEYQVSESNKLSEN